MVEKETLYSATPITTKRRKVSEMPDEKKGRYTEAQAKAAKKYLKESVEDVRIRVPKGQKAVIKDHAEKQGESMNAFVIRAIDETMKRDSSRKPDKE